MLNFIRLGAIIAISIVLMACGSDGPSRSQVMNLMQETMNEYYDGAFEVKNLKIIDSRIDSDGDAELVVEYDIAFAMNKRQLERMLNNSDQLIGGAGVMAINMLEAEHGEIKKGRVIDSNRQTLWLRKHNKEWRILN
ncbi:MAG: hypothetical protein LAT66_06490 [Alkalimonas sp.]|nr:hypothetical protein [Alkalimonas sp.]